MKKSQLITYLIFAWFWQTTALADNNSLTVYSSTDGLSMHQNQHSNPANLPGFAVIKESKKMPFQKGMFELKYDDVTAFIDPTTVSFSTPDNPNAANLLDQNYRFDLLGTDSLLARYLNKTITVSYDSGEGTQQVTGQLLSTQGGLILSQDNNKIMALRSWQDILFPALPEGLLTKPTLIWLLDSNTSQQQTVEINYQTNGMTWWADYVLALTEDRSCELELMAWVSLVNQSGKNFNDYQLKLVAGDVNQSRQSNQPVMMRAEDSYLSRDSFQQESVFEYHKYTLPRSIDLPNNSTKQISLINPKSGIQCQKKLLFDAFANHSFNYSRPATDMSFNSQTKNPPIDAQILFTNEQKNQLGIPLPAGRVRVNQADSKGALTFIGADRINHTANKETVSLSIGHSFDVKGQRQQTDFKRTKNTLTEEFTVQLSNAKPTTETVTVHEHLYRWREWNITDNSHKYKKIDANTIEFEIKLAAESEQIISYTVEYKWPETMRVNN